MGYRSRSHAFVVALSPGELFTAESVRAAVGRTIGEPKHYNAWSAMFAACLREWRKHGLVTDSHERLNAKASQAHATAIKAYRRV
jgi:hypothetical protein